MHTDAGCTEAGAFMAACGLGSTSKHNHVSNLLGK